MKNHYKLKPVALAVGLGLVATSPVTLAQQAESANIERESTIEEVVTTGSRLQGSAAAVVEERKNQAFVADILGAEQLSRSGDSDAASALRRVTGLTLVDGKFIYVRGLGERYSSARINGASIPSPDLTRNVVPLDIIPSTIIESMAVQKVFSPSMPAAFGGGNIDIRTRSLPNDFVFSVEAGVGLNSNADEGYTYNRNDAGIPEGIQNAIGRYEGDFSLRNIINTDGLTGNGTSAGDQARAINASLAKQLPRDMVLKEESLDPNFDLKATLGNSFDESWFGGTFGVLAAASYDNDWDASERRNAVISNNAEAGCSTSLETAEDVSNSCYNTLSETTVTTETERLNGFFTAGYQLDTHNVSYTKIYLEDSEDESEFGIKQSPNGSNLKTIAGTGIANREHEFKYEERVLDVDQFRGQHTFMDYWGVGFDWQYTESKAETEIPTEVSYRFDDIYNTDGSFSETRVTGDDNRAIFQFVDMEDNVKSYGGNFSLPIMLSGIELELKAGYDFMDKARYYSTSRFSLDNASGSRLSVLDDLDNVLGVTGYLTDEVIDENDFRITFREPGAPNADDYLAAQKIDAYYGEFDAIFDNTWRFSGGIRYEDFKQVSLATSSLIFDEQDLNNYFNPQRVADSSISEDDIYTALSLTYMANDNYQLRFGYGETVVRPGLT